MKLRDHRPQGCLADPNKGPEVRLKSCQPSGSEIWGGKDQCLTLHTSQTQSNTVQMLLLQWVLRKYLNTNPPTPTVVSHIYVISMLCIILIIAALKTIVELIQTETIIDWSWESVSWDVSQQQTQHLKSLMSRTACIRASITVISIIWIFFTVQNYHIFSLGKIKTKN